MLPERPRNRLQTAWWPGNRRRKKPLLRLRLIVLKRGGKRVYLLTNVLDSTRLSRPMASKVYTARWGIEICQPYCLLCHYFSTGVVRGLGVANSAA